MRQIDRARTAATWRIALAIALAAGACRASAQDVLPDPRPSAGPAMDRPPQGRPYDDQSWAELERTAGVERDAPGALPAAPPPEPSWYGRVDYFHWNERLDGADFVNEDGPLYTLGYLRRVGQERFRFEFFGGKVHYSASVDFTDGTSEPLYSTTNYIGMRAEYDYLFEPDCWPAVSLVVGLGARFWVRDLPDGFTAYSATPVWGYDEIWWTLYPYVGLEKRRTPGGPTEFYYACRVGCTPLTYQYATGFETPVFPQIGVTGQVESGIRGRSLSLAAFFEAMTWSQSPVSRDSLQPASRMFTVGLKAGVYF